MTTPHPGSEVNTLTPAMLSAQVFEPTMEASRALGDLTREVHSRYVETIEIALNAATDKRSKQNVKLMQEHATQLRCIHDELKAIASTINPAWIVAYQQLGGTQQ